MTFIQAIEVASHRGGGGKPHFSYENKLWLLYESFKYKLQASIYRNKFLFNF